MNRIMSFNDDDGFNDPLVLLLLALTTTAVVVLGTVVGISTGAPRGGRFFLR